MSMDEIIAVAEKLAEEARVASAGVEDRFDLALAPGQEQFSAISAQLDILLCPVASPYKR